MTPLPVVAVQRIIQSVFLNGSRGEEMKARQRRQSLMVDVFTGIFNALSDLLSRFGGEGLRIQFEEELNTRSDAIGGGIRFSDGRMRLTEEEFEWEPLKLLLSDLTTFANRVVGERVVRREIEAFLVRYERDNRVNLFEVRYKLDLPGQTAGH
jgi:hypothetical protein